MQTTTTGARGIKARLASVSFILWLTVIIPTALAVIYFGLIASDVYISESRFVVRSPQRQAQSGLGALFQGTGFSRSQDDTYSVHDFILSRDALKELDDQLGVRKAYSSKDADFINRFPGVDWDDSFEAFYRYYRNRVTLDYDTVSSITILKVRAFNADDSKNINDLLLKMGERLVNNLNDGLAWGLFPIFFANTGMSIGRIGVLAALYPAVWGLGQLYTGGLSDRIGRKPLIVGGMLTQAVAIAWIAATGSFATWAVGAMVLGAGTAMVYPTLLAAIGDVAHPTWRARSVGVYRLWRDSGFAIGALLAGILADLISIPAAIYAVAALTAISGLVVAVRMYETHPR